MVPFWGTLNIRCHIIIGTQKGTIILTTTHMVVRSINLFLNPKIYVRQENPDQCLDCTVWQSTHSSCEAAISCAAPVRKAR